MARQVRVRRIYDDPETGEGARVLVDRVWPRGVKKADAHLEEWLKDVAPSPELRKWYSHDPERYDEFARRYRAELKDADRAAALDRLRDLADQGRVTLLTAAKRSDISQATVLADLLTKR